MQSLKERFERFLTSFEGFEKIDAVLKPQPLHGIDRADYLLWGRKIIVEQKSLDATDSTAKVQRFYNDKMNDGRSIIFGTVPIQRVFERRPDGPKLHHSLVLRLSRSVEKHVQKADNQTMATRKIFSIPESTGVLIILNDQVEILTPQMIHYRLSEVFRRKTDDGGFRYPNNNGVVLICETAAQNQAEGILAHMMAFINPNRLNEDIVKEFYKLLYPRWLKFNNYRGIIT
jgi:hypothetical protein